MKRPPGPTREEKKAATREALLDAAARVFARQGYVATSVDEVAWEAGMTKGAVYSNFASKDELFAAVIERHQDRQMLAISGRVDPQRPADEQTRLAADQFLAILNSQHDLTLLYLEYLLYAARHPDGHEAMRERIRRMKHAVGETIVQMSERSGDFKIAIPLDDLVTAFLALGDGFSLQRLADPTVPDDLYATMLSIFVRGLETLSVDQRAGKAGRSKRS